MESILTENSEKSYRKVILPNGATGELQITSIPAIAGPSTQYKRKALNIIFCLPGNQFSGKFMQCWTRLLIHCMKNGINSEILQMSSSNIYHVRECFLAQTVLSTTPNIKPFGGKHYDYSFWCDSDQLYSPEDLEKLIARDVDIVGGAIRVTSSDEYAFGWFDEELMREENELKRMTVEEMKGRQSLIEVDFMGFAFTLVKYGVFESLRFPFFEALPYNVEPACAGKIGMQGEDLSTCHRLRKLGYKCYIDPLVKIPHEKLVPVV